ncbi:MAG: hypothetical protein RL095_3673 [Verrucomicrobiota bacterium]|jgi:hypothetical protein
MILPRLAFALFLGLSLHVLAEEKAKAEKHAVKRHADEPADAKEGDKGTVSGSILSIERGILTLTTEKGRFRVLPYWRGGMPADGGGFDKETLKKLEGFKKGDKVSVAWTFEEHPRIDSIKKLE